VRRPQPIPNTGSEAHDHLAAERTFPGWIPIIVAGVSITVSVGSVILVMV
jgi:uncharacterized membrane protein YidH (DUF202 family)